MQAAEVLDDDRRLSDRARRGAPEAFDALVIKYRDRAYRLAWRMTGSQSDAEEIVQEAFLRAYRALATFRGDSRFGTWFFRIVANEALMRKRAAARRPTLAFEACLPRDTEERVSMVADSVLGAEQLLDQKRITEQVRAALSLLDEAQRAALVLRDLEELSSEEVAEILGVEPETVRQRAHRARLKLRVLLAHLSH